jgi:hypothetical protein
MAEVVVGLNLGGDLDLGYDGGEGCERARSEKE